MFSGKFLNIVSNWPGSCHDSFIFRTSNLSYLLERSHRGFDMDEVLLGGSGYPCKRYLVTPYLHPGTELVFIICNSTKYYRSIRL